MALPTTYSLTPGPGIVSAYAGREGTVVAEIAGRDSVAALISVARTGAGVPGGVLRTVVPTAVFTGTEYGDPSTPEGAVDYLARHLPDIEFAPLSWVGDPRMWSALNGRFASVIADRHAIWSPCLACHLYMHLCRIPLSRALGCVPIVAGERETHDGAIKYSQTARSIDICIDVLASAGLDLLEPLRHANGADVAALVGDEWRSSGAQLECVHSGNYRGLDGSVSLDSATYERYVEGFLRPAGRALAAALVREDVDADPFELIRTVLEESE